MNKRTEYNGLEFLSAIGPWLSPLVPAMISYADITSFLTFGADVSTTTLKIMAIIIASVIEIIGLTTGHTLAKYQVWNKSGRDRRKKDKEKINLFPIFISFAIYLTVVVMLNVVLPWNHITPQEGYTRLSIVTLTIPSIIVLSTRSIHKEILDERAQEEARKREQKAERRREKEERKATLVAPSQNGKTTKELLELFMAENRITPNDIGDGGDWQAVDVARAIGKTPGSVRTTLHRLKG